MQSVEKRNIFANLSVLAILWVINLLIVIFGSPFLIYHKVRGIFVKPLKFTPQENPPKTKPARYFPCHIDLN